jgi:stress response protein YsnF
MPPSIDTVQSWQGRTMVDPAGDKLGTIDAIYLDDETGQPEWAAVTSGPAISEEEHEVTLREEEVVVEKRAVPKERVRMDTEAVTDERQVSEEVR